jgi:hypothetical protein
MTVGVDPVANIHYGANRSINQAVRLPRTETGRANGWNGLPKFHFIRLESITAPVRRQ